MRTIFKKYSHLIKPFDIIIVLVLLALSFLPNAIFAYQQATRKEEAKIYAILTIDGEEIERFELSENAPHEEFIYFPHDDQYNIIEVDGTRIRDKEDNSPDQIAVQTGWISQPGQTSICLPHGLMIEIVSTEPATVPVPRRRAFCPLPLQCAKWTKITQRIFINQAIS